MSNFTYSGTTYQIIDTAKTWLDAKTYAESFNGYLAIVSSQGENDAIINQALNYISTSNSANDGGGSRYIWLGGSDIQTEGNFKWVDNSNISSGFSNWGSGFITEPDDYEGQDALAMALEPWPAGSGGIGTAGKWNDIDESNLMYFVIEFNPLVEDPEDPVDPIDPVDPVTPKEVTLESEVTTTLLDEVFGLKLIGSQKINGTGNSLANLITGNISANNLSGLAGDDTLDGGLGIDTLLGGLGNDTYYVDSSKDLVTENSNEGTDAVIAPITYVIGKNVENLTLSGVLKINGTGNTLANNISGNAADNSLVGGAGNDSIDGGDGNDTLVGGVGDDTLYAQGGNDVIITNSGLDWAYGGEGNDKITGSKDGDHLEGNDGNDTIIGAAGNDALWGSAGNDSIAGGVGNDYIWAGIGNDTLSGGAGKDRFHFGEAELGSSNVDVITDFKDDEIYLYSNPFSNQYFISVNLLSNANSGEGIIYEKSSGILYYDNDGAGIGDAGIAFAILTGKPNITATNFL